MSSSFSICDSWLSGLLPELDMLRQLLEKEPEWADDARDVAERQLKLCSNIASRFIRLGTACEVSFPCLLLMKADKDVSWHRCR